ncbi:MAG: chloride channel protein [Rhizobiales bacterium]|nr:chloride channel protein [Hyphomicrobiales bacterium]
MFHFTSRITSFLSGQVSLNLQQFRSERWALLWTLAALVGLACAGAAILFRFAISGIQLLWLGTMSETILDIAHDLPWWTIILAPTLAGLVVGVILQWLMPSRRAEGVADVIEVQMMRDGEIPLRNGLWNAVLTAISLGGGASAGREGPVVHLGATLASAVGRMFTLTIAARRIILSCGAAAAVSASFNAPLAGVVFAHEIVLGYYSRAAFIPIAVSSATAAIISRLWFGDFPAFIIPSYQITSYWEFPAFALLGWTCAAVAILFQYGIVIADKAARNIVIPLWTRPVIGGLMIGIMALWIPEILGVGYEATDKALHQQIPLLMLILFVAAKCAATAITLASRFGGGIFSPSLYIGAMTGSAFGFIAASAYPEMASSNGLYAILGMGAIAGSVLGAPLSTILIVFELTGGLAMSVALLVTVSISYALTQLVFSGSFFKWQLAMRGIFLHEGKQNALLNGIRVRDFLQPAKADEAPPEINLETSTNWLLRSDNLETALRTIDAAGRSRVPVFDRGNPDIFVGWAVHVDALETYNTALIRASHEEHS